MQKLVLSLVLALGVAAVFAGLRDAGYVWNDPRELLTAESAEPAKADARREWRLQPHEPYEPLAPSVIAAVKATPAGQKGDASTFHMLSVGVHVLSAVFVFLILSLVTGAPGAAFVGALVFGVHPLQVEPVSYIASLKFVLGGCLALLATWQYLSFVQANAARDARGKTKPLRRFWVGTIAFAAALLATPATVVTPAIAWLLAKLLPKRSSLIATRVPSWPLVLWTVLAIPVVVLAIQGQNTHALSSQLPFWSRPIVAADAVSFYLSKMFVPILIGPDYGRSPSYIVQHWWGFVTWVLPVMLVAVLSYWRGKTREAYASAVAVLVVALAPFLGLVLFEAQATSTVANPYAYLALLAPAIAAAYTVAVPRKSWLPALVIIAALALAYVSRTNVEHWKSDEALWTHAEKVNPTSPIAHETLGDNFRRNGDWQNARLHYQKVLEVNAVAPQVNFHLAEIERQHGDPKVAVELYKKVIELDPGHAEAYGRLGLAYLDEGDHDAALTHFRKAVELAPDSEEPLRYLGMLYVRKNEYAEAIPYLNRALRLGEESASKQAQSEIHALLGLALARTGQGEAAQGHLETALKLDPSHKDAHRTLGDIYFAQNKYAEARPHYEQAVAVTKDDPVLYRNLGLVLAEAKQNEKAIGYFQKAIELKPGNPETLNALGIAQFRTRQLKDAEATFKKTLELDPNRADPHYYLGDIARWQGKEPEALDEYYRALKIDAHHPDANYRLGNYFLKKNNVSQAIRHFQAALKAAPEDPRLIYSLKKAEKSREGADGASDSAQM